MMIGPKFCFFFFTRLRGFEPLPAGGVAGGAVAGAGVGIWAGVGMGAGIGVDAEVVEVLGGSVGKACGGAAATGS
jgi:hypothetical protein